MSSVRWQQTHPVIDPIVLDQDDLGHAGVGQLPPLLADPRLGVGLAAERLGRAGDRLSVDVLVPPTPRHPPFPLTSGLVRSTLRRPPVRPGFKVRGMSDDRWNTVLVLGGIRSGKSAFAEALVADAPSVRYVATAVGGEDDPEWIARIEEHQRRRPQTWSTEETGADPARLTALLTEAKPDDTLLVDDLGGWVAALLDPARQPNDDQADVVALASAVRACTARVVLVSPEV